MKRTAVLIVTLVLVAGFGWTDGQAQLPENHYLVYDVPDQWTYDVQLVIFDQFNPAFFADSFVLDKFATPVQKNGEPMFNAMMHQTWWQIHDPQPVWEVVLDNQFGLQTWQVTDGRYLVLPALKFDPSPIPPWNHYKCYDAVGPPVDIPVVLVDQFWTYEGIAALPEQFCNPCQKEVFEGEIYPIIEPEVHLACYRLEPAEIVAFAADAFDQFGMWPVMLEETCWLCLPTEKLQAEGTQQSTWSDVKSLYRD